MIEMNVVIVDVLVVHRLEAVAIFSHEAQWVIWLHLPHCQQPQALRDLIATRSEYAADKRRGTAS